MVRKHVKMDFFLQTRFLRPWLVEIRWGRLSFRKSFQIWESEQGKLAQSLLFCLLGKTINSPISENIQIIRLERRQQLPTKNVKWMQKPDGSG